MKLTITSEETKAMLNAVLDIATDDLDESEINLYKLASKEETPYARYELKRTGEIDVEVNSDVIVFILSNRKFIKTCSKIYDFVKAGIKLFEDSISAFKAIANECIKKFDPETWKKMEEEKRKEEEYKRKTEEREFRKMYEEEKKEATEEEKDKDKTKDAEEESEWI